MNSLSEIFSILFLGRNKGVQGDALWGEIQSSFGERFHLRIGSILFRDPFRSGIRFRRGSCTYLGTNPVTQSALAW